MSDNKKTIIALGNFDGVHIGHSALLTAAVNTAKQTNAQPMVWTFERHKYSPSYITSKEDKIALFRKAGIEKVCFADFFEVRDYTPERFVDEILIGKHNCKGVVCGFNFHFGAAGRGDASTLRHLCRERNLECTVCDAVKYNGSPVSSTRIREALTAGDLDKANAMLGRDWSVELPVLEGRKVGRGMGMPTINQHFPDGMVIPSHGVYAGYARIDGRPQLCVTNIGVRPTFGTSDLVTCESHLLDYTGDLYGQTVRLTLKKYLRPEKKFGSPEDLVAQIRRDIEAARAIG